MTFDEHFESQYLGRWPTLKEALLRQKPRHFLLTNPYGEAYQDYSLDEASWLATQCVPLRDSANIADFCASPGGKSLSLIFRAKKEQHQIRWHLNDVSRARAQRLKAVMHDCLPASKIEKIEFTCADASRFGQTRPEYYDAIVVDAPCSGERHLLNSPAELARWSLKGSQRLSIRQNALLCSALDSLRPGGSVLYSTCSISFTENDGTIERFMKSRKNQFRTVETSGAGEPTKYGRIILPDTEGCGPIYYCLIEKSDES